MKCLHLCRAARLFRVMIAPTLASGETRKNQDQFEIVIVDEGSKPSWSSIDSFHVTKTARRNFHQSYTSVVKSGLHQGYSSAPGRGSSPGASFHCRTILAINFGVYKNRCTMAFARDQNNLSRIKGKQRRTPESNVSYNTIHEMMNI